MPWNDELTLVGTVPPAEPADENKFPNAPTEAQRRDVFADRKSVGHTEFYEANVAGLTATLKFDVYAGEYEGELLAEYKGMPYKVLRTYEHGGDKIELTLSDQSMGGADRGIV